MCGMWINYFVFDYVLSITDYLVNTPSSSFMSIVDHYTINDDCLASATIDRVRRVGIGGTCVGTWKQCSAIKAKDSFNGIWKRNRFSTVWVLFEFHRHTLVEFAGFNYKFCSFLTLTWINKWFDKTCKGFMGVSVLVFFFFFGTSEFENYKHAGLAHDRVIARASWFV